MEDKTIIAIAGMIVLSVILAIVMICGPENLELKVALAASIVTVVGTIVAYAYGIERGKNKE